jgi:hypothetical protein
MCERQQRSGRPDFRQRRRREPRGADVDAVAELELSHLHERRDRLEISFLQRNVGAPQRLAQPRDLEASAILSRIEAPLRQGLADSATNRRRTSSCGSQSVRCDSPKRARSKYASHRIIRASLRILPAARLCAPFGGRFGFIGHRRPRFPDFDHHTIILFFSNILFQGASPNLVLLVSWHSARRDAQMQFAFT